MKNNFTFEELVDFAENIMPEDVLNGDEFTFLDKTYYIVDSPKDAFYSGMVVFLDCLRRYYGLDMPENDSYLDDIEFLEHKDKMFIDRHGNFVAYLHFEEDDDDDEDEEEDWDADEADDT